MTTLQEKIARSLVPHERALVGSFYGKFFARNLNLYLLQRNPEQWKNIQINQKSTAPAPSELQKKANTTIAQTTDFTDAPAPPTDKKKRKTRPEDEIDQLFEQKLGKKVKKAELKTEEPSQLEAVEVKKERKRHKKDGEAKDRELEDVLGAIKAAPKDEKRHHKKKKTL